MKHRLLAALAAVMMIFLAACHQNKPPAESAPWEEPSVSSQPETSETTVSEPVVSEPIHSQLYIPGVSVEDVILYFNEVCLDSEIINSGDPSYVQKWIAPIYYSLEGDYTDADLAMLASFTDWLNSIEGFPGISRNEDPLKRNLRIHFCDEQTLLSLMGQNFAGTDGAVTFWYADNIICDAIICYRTDLNQYLRNSVILEEIYNGLGPIQDTSLRPDSIIYQEFSQPQQLTAIDELILRLLYHPDIQPGMNKQQCEQVIRSLYY